jgi:[ribosomal protein S18]-alanine N-acetyltransferase
MAALRKPTEDSPRHRQLAIMYRDITAADLDRLAEIEATVYEFPWTRGNFRDSLESGYIMVGAFHHNELLAYAILMLAVDEAHLLNLAVAQPVQGLGIGRALLGHMIETAAERDCTMIYLEVRPSNAAARQLYAQTGFRQIAIRPNYYPARRGREDALFLGLRINPVA